MQSWIVRAASFVLALAVAAAASVSLAQDSDKDLVRAKKKVGREARLAAVDGDFALLSKILQEAPEAVRKDPDLRFQIAENVLKSIKKTWGEERRPGLVVARDSFAVAAEGKPDDVEAVVGALDCADETAELDFVGKRPKEAESQADWAVTFGEKILETGNTTPPVKSAVAAAYRMRAKVSHKVRKLDRIISDYDRAGVLIGEILAAGDPGPADLGDAATTFLAKAKFIHDAIPLDDETRDDEAVRKAVEFAGRACAMKGAETPEFNVHLQALRSARTFGITDDLGMPVMQTLKPGIKGLKLEIPRADGWTKEKVGKGQTYDLFFTRKFEGETKAVQIMITEWGSSEVSYGMAWNKLSDVAEARWEGQVNRFDRITSSVPLLRLGIGGKTGKKAKKAKGPEVWHFQVAGVPKSGGREVRQAEWMWRSGKKAKVCHQIQIYDYGTPWALGDPDVQAFVTAAVGAKFWPDPAAVVQKK